MKRLRESLSVAVLAGAAAMGGAVGYHLLTRGPLVAAETPAKAAPVLDRAALDAADELSTALREAGKVVSPSVVNINVVKTVKNPHGSMNNDDLRRFFRQFGPDMPDIPQIPDTPDNGGGSMQEEVGTGSGVIMQVEGTTGYILTNNHVAGDAGKMVITLADGREIDNAKLVGTDPKTDLAVVKITADNLPAAAKWGDSDELQQGDLVLAFGSPFGYVGSMTHGIVSALDRTNVGILGRMGYEDFIQVDAPINPGNSGGPLTNLRGEVVGVNSAIASRTGGFQGIGFAIPSDLAHHIFDTLREHGKVTRGWLGVRIDDVAHNRKVARSLGYTGQTGVLVEQTIEGNPAYGKLQNGDIITGMNGKELQTGQQLRNTIAATSPNTEVVFQVFRQGKTQDVTVKLGEQPEEMAAAESHDRANSEEAAPHKVMGLTLKDVSPEVAHAYGLGENAGGALVTAVTPQSAASRAGVQAGDVITKVDDQVIASAREAADALDKVKLDKGVRLYVANQDGERFLYIQENGQ